MNFVMAYNHLFHENFGMSVPDVLHQFSGTAEKELNIRFISALPKDFAFLHGGDVKGFIGDARFRGFDTIPDSVFHRCVIELIGK